MANDQLIRESARIAAKIATIDEIIDDLQKKRRILRSQIGDISGELPGGADKPRLESSGDYLS